MSIAVEYAPHNMSHRAMVDNMSRPLTGWHQGSSATSSDAYYAREQHMSQPPRLPSMASIISTATQGARDHYGTPSPLGHTPPQLLNASIDPYNMSRRPPTDIRLSPAQSSVASDRSDEYQDILRMRQPGGREYVQAQPHMPRMYAPTRQHRETFHHHAGPPLQSPFGKLVPEHVRSHAGPAPPPRQPHSPPTPQASTSPRQASMSISNLLSDSAPSKSAPKAPMRSPPLTTDVEYKITVRQQPYAARSCGFGERDRRVIDPPPIIQLTAHNPNLSAEELAAKARNPFSVVHCSIWDETGVKDMSTLPEDFRQNRRLMGTLVASPFFGQDENGEEGAFFCFPDLSCRTPGTFRLLFQIVILENPLQPGVLGFKSPGNFKAPVLCTAVSEPFQVFNAKDFPGMKASTPLTKRLKEQGCLISIKKGNDKTGASHCRDESDDDDEEREKKRNKRQRKH